MGTPRRAMVEAAWSTHLPARVARLHRDRLEGLPKEVRDIARKAEVRLCARPRRLITAGKPTPVVIATIAREMSGLAWTIEENGTVAISRCHQDDLAAPHEAAPGTKSDDEMCCDYRPRA